MLLCSYSLEGEKYEVIHKDELYRYRRSVWTIRKLVLEENTDFDAWILEKEAANINGEIIPLKEKLGIRQGELNKLQEIQKFIKDVLPEISADDLEKEPKSIMERLRNN